MDLEIKKSCSGDGIADAGQDVKLEINGQEVLDIKVPEGKTWHVHYNIAIVETDA